MAKEINISVTPEVFRNDKLLKETAARYLSIDQHNINATRIVRRSIDARHGSPLYQLKVEVHTDGETPLLEAHRFDYQQVKEKPPVIIVGAGPAGLFAALKLLEKGLRPVIIERGKNVKERKYDIARLTREHIVNPNSNWCFGEGGAGTFSDGKLYTRSNKRGNIGHILQQLVNHGANPDIMVDSHAHIGTDKLSSIITRIRETIINRGGEYYFNKKVSDLIVKDGQVHGVETEDGSRFEGIAVILATGHSARDIYKLFRQKGWALDAKPFAIGVRAEHPQALINEIQYNGHKGMPPASYNLVTQAGNHGVFSFCMCPGGIMVPAATNPGELVINGMSNSQRNSPFANAAIVVQVNPDDYFGQDQYGSLAGMYFQQEIERTMFKVTGETQQAPAQRMVDFVNQKSSPWIIPTSYIPGVVNAPLHKLLPGFVAQSLRQAFLDFDRKMRGYLSEEAMLVAVESRTSSPVRIPRDPRSLQHPQLINLYPCGEGAGYAGGITSSAIDGVNCAEQVAMSYRE